MCHVRVFLAKHVDIEACFIVLYVGFVRDVVLFQLLADVVPQRIDRNTTPSGSAPVLGFAIFHFLLTTDAARRPGYAFQAFEADRFLTIDTETVRPVRYRVKRSIQLGQKVRSASELGGVLFPHVHALNLIQRIVFTFSDCDRTCLCMYLAHEFPAHVLDNRLKTERLFLCDHRAFLDYYS